MLGRLFVSSHPSSALQVLVRLVGADEHIYAFHADALQWLADTDLLEMLVDKLSPPVCFFFLNFFVEYGTIFAFALDKVL
jgi:hypothetical protein